MLRLGYPCMNLVLGAGTSATLRLASLPDREKVESVVARNIEALELILRWNARHGVRLFRVGTSFIPFASHDAFPYDWRERHAGELARVGRLARELGQRVSIHPGQYVCCGSEDAGVVGRSLAELRYAARLMELFQADDGVVVVHVGGAYGDKAAAADRFVRALEGEDLVRRYVALENDERVWAPHEVIAVARRLRVTAIVDTLHHRLNPGTMSLRDAMLAAADTWSPPATDPGQRKKRGAERRQKLHISSQDPDKVRGAHAYGIHPADWDELLRVTEGLEADVMIESKGKEQSLRPLGLAAIPALPYAAEPDEPAPRSSGREAPTGAQGRTGTRAARPAAAPRARRGRS